LGNAARGGLPAKQGDKAKYILSIQLGLKLGGRVLSEKESLERLSGTRRTLLIAGVLPEGGTSVKELAKGRTEEKVFGQETSKSPRSTKRGTGASYPDENQKSAMGTEAFSGGIHLKTFQRKKMPPGKGEVFCLNDKNRRGKRILS